MNTRNGVSSKRCSINDSTSVRGSEVPCPDEDCIPPAKVAPKVDSPGL